eukprot:360908-Chlamydomonas_euryale.AAC.5
MPTFEQRGEAPPPHIPPFLPAFPDAHTFEHTPAFPGHEQAPAKQTEVRGQKGSGVALVERRAVGWRWWRQGQRGDAGVGTGSGVVLVLFLRSPVVAFPASHRFSAQTSHKMQQTKQQHNNKNNNIDNNNINNKNNNINNKEAYIQQCSKQ